MAGPKIRHEGQVPDAMIYMTDGYDFPWRLSDPTLWAVPESGWIRKILIFYFIWGWRFSRPLSFFLSFWISLSLRFELDFSSRLTKIFYRFESWECWFVSSMFMTRIKIFPYSRKFIRSDIKLKQSITGSFQKEALIDQVGYLQERSLDKEQWSYCSFKELPEIASSAILPRIGKESLCLPEPVPVVTTKFSFTLKLFWAWAWWLYGGLKRICFPPNSTKFFNHN